MRGIQEAEYVSEKYDKGYSERVKSERLKSGHVARKMDQIEVDKRFAGIASMRMKKNKRKMDRRDQENERGASAKRRRVEAC